MDKMRDLTLQIRRNQQDVGDFMKDLDSWTSDIKKQDDSLKTMKPRQQAESAYPPVRSKAIVEKVKKKRDADAVKAKKERIKSSDYKKWEKLDVDAMLKEVDDDENAMDEEVQIEVEKLDAARKEKVAAEMKEKGNDHFRKCGYEAAIECYTTGMQADSSNPIFPANRAMAYLKLKKYAETEADCTLALSLDPTYTKAYLRRGTARIALGKSSSARKDFTDALRMEPGNPQAKSEIAKLDEHEKGGKSRKADDAKAAGSENEVERKSQYVQPIFIPPKLRSKKPLMRVEVQEIGFEDAAKKDETISNMELDAILGRKRKSDEKVEKTEENSENPMMSIMTQHEVDSVEELTELKKEERKCPKLLVEEIASDDKTMKPSTMPTTHVNGFDHTKADTTLNSNTPQSNQNSAVTPTTARIPPRPTTSFQFQAHVKQLTRHPDALVQYIFQIQPAQITSLLKEQLETETLLPVLRCFHNSDSHDIVMEYLSQFARVKRFEMAILFMSESEKNDVRSLFVELEKALPSQKGELNILGKKYGL